MPRDEVATRITVFLSENDRLAHHGLAEALLERARHSGIAGATVWRGIEGFGRSGDFRTARFPDVVSGLPLAVELIDAPERIESFLPLLAELAPGSFATRQEVRINRFDPAEPEA